MHLRGKGVRAQLGSFRSSLCQMLPQPSFSRKDHQVCFQQDDLTASRAASVSDCASVSVTRESQRTLKWPMPLQPVEPGLHWEATVLKTAGMQIGRGLRLECENWAPLLEEGWEQEEGGSTDLRGTDHPSGAYQAFTTCKFKSPFMLFLSQNGPFYRLGNRGSARLHKLPRTM